MGTTINIFTTLCKYDHGKYLLNNGDVCRALRFALPYIGLHNLPADPSVVTILVRSTLEDVGIVN